MTVVRGISFDYGNVLGTLDVLAIAQRARGFLQGDSLAREVAFSEERAVSDALLALLPAAYRAHDEVVFAGGGHEGGWRALMAVLAEKALGATVSRLTIDTFVDVLWKAQPERNLWCAVPDEARELLQWLQERKIPMVITSNSEGRLLELLTQVRLASFFVRVLDSGLLGISKPAPEIFYTSARTLELSPAEIVHIGDSEAADVVGAIGAGMHAIRFDAHVPGLASRPTKAAYRCDNYAQLRAVLQELLQLSST